MSKLGLLLIAVALTAVLFAGCGGGDDPAPAATGISLSGSGTITSSDQEWSDGSYYDIQTFEPDHDCTVQISMNSTQVDAYIGLFDGDGNYIDEADGGGSGTNARLTVDVYAGTSYSVMFNTAGSGDFGSYTWTIREITSSSSTAAQSGNKGGKLSLAKIIKK